MVELNVTEQMPSTQAPPVVPDFRDARAQRALRLRAFTEQVFTFLLAAYELDGPATPTVRRDLLRQADRAIARASQSRTAQAQSRARMSMDALIDSAVFVAKLPDADHSQRHLVNAAIDRVAENIRQQYPALITVQSFETGLLEPDAREVSDLVLADRICLKCSRTLFTPADRVSQLCQPCRETAMAGSDGAR